MEPYADLHTHSRFSDGLLGIPELLENIKAADGLACFSLNDHDSLSGIEPMFRLLASQYDDKKRLRFIPGIEISTEEKHTKTSVHILGYFPGIHQGNHKQELKRLDSILGGYCRIRCRDRGVRDLDGRVIRAFQLNLDGLADRYQSAQDVIKRIHAKAQSGNEKIFADHHKDDDIIRHPIPLSYQLLIDAWPDLIPGGSREKIRLCILRPDSEKKRRLASWLMAEEGLSSSDAEEAANQLQGCLGGFDPAPSTLLSPVEGLKLLKESGAHCFLAHPAVFNHRFTFNEFDELVTRPLIKAGLDGIEVFYPYAHKVRVQSEKHYREIAKNSGLRMSGGTDYHGDHRSEFGDIQLPLSDVNRLF